MWPFSKKEKNTVPETKVLLEPVERYEQPVRIINDDDVLRRRIAAKILQFIKLGNLEEAERRAKFFYDRGEHFLVNEQHCLKVMHGK